MDSLLHPDAQTIRANLELYTEGDTDFRNELLTLMVGDLKDLQESFKEAFLASCPDLFVKTVHKAKVTLEILCCYWLIGSSDHSQLFLQKDDFITFCDKLIATLRTELGSV